MIHIVGCWKLAYIHFTPFPLLGWVGLGCIRLDGSDWGFVWLVDFDWDGFRLVLLGGGCIWFCERLWLVIWGQLILMRLDEVGSGLMKLFKFWLGWLSLSEVHLFAKQEKSISIILGFAKWVWTNLMNTWFLLCWTHDSYCVHSPYRFCCQIGEF